MTFYCDLIFGQPKDLRYCSKQNFQVLTDFAIFVEKRRSGYVKNLYD